ncbi:unnamed protein product [Urochloa humidicola]
MAAANYCGRLQLPPCPLLPVFPSLPPPLASRRLRRARPPFASWHPPPQPPPPSPAPALPKKRVSGANREAAGAEGAVADQGAEAEEQQEYGDGDEYLSSVGASFSLPARLRAARAAPGGDPVFFLLAAVAVTTCVAFTGMVVVAIPTMLS